MPGGGGAGDEKVAQDARVDGIERADRDVVSPAVDLSEDVEPIGRERGVIICVLAHGVLKRH